VRFLVERGGANVNAVSVKDGSTALMFASKEGHLEIARYLCQNNANWMFYRNDGKDAYTITSNHNMQNIIAKDCALSEILKNPEKHSKELVEMATNLMPSYLTGGRTRHRSKHRPSTRKRVKRSKRTARK
jgi:hypothetical protein